MIPLAKKLIFDTTEEIWDEVIEFKRRHKLENNNNALEELLKRGIKTVKSDSFFIKQDDEIKINKEALDQIQEFYHKIPTLELKLGRPLIILKDEKTDAFYTECHISAKDLISLGDKDAVIDPDYQEDFRANRELQPSNTDFHTMQNDAKKGRQFSDLVIDYNTEYRPEIPLKVLGGQHRIEAVKDALKLGMNRFHGIRVYFNLNKEQRVEIAIISNTNINVSPDLRDRLEEQKLDPPSKLRNWCHNIGILEKDKDFGDRKTQKEFIPTVRMMRTFIVNFYSGKSYKGEFDNEPITPSIAKAGGMDKEYLKVFNKIKGNFMGEKDLTDAGKMFVRLHETQIKNSTEDFKLKAQNLALIASWAFATGILQRDKQRLKKLYELPELSGNDDPLNASAMTKARHNKLDSDTYRGLGTRTDTKERGRLLQLFLGYSRSDKKKITLDMCNAAIIKFHSLEDKKNAIKWDKKAF